MDDVQWHFREMARGEINQNPMEREFFVAETINERLVREAIQNSLDASYARADRTSIPGPVRVRFSLRGVRHPLSPDRAGAYLPSLLEHLAEGLDQNDDFRRQIAQPGLLGEGMQYLVVEDSGTVGLEGDWLQYDDSAQESAQDNNFYWFFRNVGRSGKSDTDGGSWGLGKWVFPDSSHASAYIAVTRRRSDGETLLMGQAVLTKHNVDGQRYAPYGYFGVLGDENLAVPLRMSEPAHRPLIEQCIADFGLRLRDEPGLSVIIPFPRVAEDPPINKDHIAAAVVHNYFFPIIAGRLEVTVDEGDGSLPTEITTDTIDDVLHHIPLEASGERSMGSYQRLFDICRDAATLPDRDYIELNSPPQKSLQYEHYDELADLRSRYDAGELLAFRVKTEVRKKDGTETPTSFRLFVQHDDSLTPGHDFYVRGALSISTMDLIKRYRARTLLIVDEEEPLAAMLRDSEPPAHTAWRPQSDRVKKRWVSPTRRINDVLRSPETLLSIWESTPAPVQRDALADIFPSIVQGERRRRREAAGKVGGDKAKVGPITSHADFDIQRNGVGFRVRLAAGVAQPPTRVLLQVAYETPRGNPLKSYSQHDFRLHGDGALDLLAEGCRVSSGAAGNEVLLDIDDPDRFSVIVRGFDERRDVLARLDRVENAPQGSGGSE